MVRNERVGPPPNVYSDGDDAKAYHDTPEDRDASHAGDRLGVDASSIGVVDRIEFRCDKSREGREDNGGDDGDDENDAAFEPVHYRYPFLLLGAFESAWQTELL